ncbi:hypothetical protein RHRU231_610003 [Rhodococcus ruber]|uniref:Uncharacterized protein n=1 Tax=Rhodococcus ruber TaxID=1830 RepID=A0A098BN15_9NOCA|nr:hypothetical protein RHRU231_610003 [Rhodococcus ruber]
MPTFGHCRVGARIPSPSAVGCRRHRYLRSPQGRMHLSDAVTSPPGASECVMRITGENRQGRAGQQSAAHPQDMKIR